MTLKISSRATQNVFADHGLAASVLHGFDHIESIKHFQKKYRYRPIEATNSDSYNLDTRPTCISRTSSMRTRATRCGKTSGREMSRNSPGTIRTCGPTRTVYGKRLPPNLPRLCRTSPAVNSTGGWLSWAITNVSLAPVTKYSTLFDVGTLLDFDNLLCLLKWNIRYLDMLLKILPMRSVISNFALVSSIHLADSKLANSDQTLHLRSTQVGFADLHLLVE